MTALVWSYGGGTQSVAMAVLVAQGRLPRPEAIVIADTGRETRATWEYTDAHVRALLAPSVIEVIGHEAARVDLYDPRGRLLIPAFTKDGAARLPAFCSAEWKRDVVARWLRGRGYGPKRPVTMWLGISVDELHRAKPGRRDWLQHGYPLLFDVPMRRSDCVELVRSAGLPSPPRSACWMCPHRSNEQWRVLRDERPDEFTAAIEFERGLRQQRPDVSLHKSGRPIDQAPIDTAADDRGLWDQDACDTGFCFV